jgi:hypothetical protein
MATYEELHGLLTEPELIKKVQMAIVESARMVADGEDTGPSFDQDVAKAAARILWAADVIQNTGAAAEQALPLVLMANKASTVATILAATDSAFQNNVNDMVDALASRFL